jgi:hypothetical protein
VKVDLVRGTMEGNRKNGEVGDEFSGYLSLRYFKMAFTGHRELPNANNLILTPLRNGSVFEEDKKTSIYIVGTCVTETCARVK